MIFRTVKPVILSILFLFANGVVSAQDFRPGYVVTSSGDSLSGYVAYRQGSRNTKTCIFKKDKRSQATRYTVDQLKGFGIHGDKRFETIQVPPNGDSLDRAFAHIIVDGPMTLHRVNRFYTVSYAGVTHVLRSPKDKYVGDSKGLWYKADKHYVGILTSLALSCPVSAEETNYNLSDLAKFASDFNRCKGSEDTKVYSQKFVKANVNIFGAFVMSNATTDLFEEITFEPSQTVSGGIGLDLSSPRLFDRLFFSTELWYLKFLHQAYIEETFPAEKHYRDVILKGSYVKIPIGFRYNFLHERNTPYIKAGVSFSVIGDCSVRVVMEKESNGTVYGDEVYDDTYRFRSPRFLWGAIGYDKSIAGKMRAFVECRYEAGTGVVGTKIQTFSTLNNLNFLAGIRF